VSFLLNWLKDMQQDLNGFLLFVNRMELFQFSRNNQKQTVTKQVSITSNASDLCLETAHDASVELNLNKILFKLIKHLSMHDPKQTYLSTWKLFGPSYYYWFI
jgi:hypothetical protein